MPRKVVRSRRVCRVSQAGLLACFLAAAVSCSSGETGSRVTGAARGGSGAQTGAGGTGTTFNPEDPLVSTMPSGVAGQGVSSVNAAGSGGSSDEVEACAQTAQEAQQVPVDMYIMLDRSSSMDELTGAGPSKWDAIRSALASFLNDTRSTGLGVGLQFFPFVPDGVPDRCTRDADCGANGGDCLTGICQPSEDGSFSLQFCSPSAPNDCGADTLGCVTTVGQCSLDTSFICFNPGGLLGCGAQGACQRVNVGKCRNFESCTVGDYAQPAVDIATLPQNANALIDELQAEVTVGLTPTAAALSGAIRHAQDYARTQSTHRVIAVLATDGLPTECDPVDPAGIATIASGGLASTPSVSTYVVGVFTSDDTGARANLDSWAAAGGTDEAFIVDPTQDVSAQFLDALDKIRSGSIACEYQLPAAPTGSALDLDRVNVALVEGSKSSDFRYVGDASRCGLAPLGWYYDADPQAGGKPTKIITCATACDSLKSTNAGRVEVRLGCQTKGPD